MKLLRILQKRLNSSHVYGSKFTPIESTLDQLLLGACEENDHKLMASFELQKKTFTFGEMHNEGLKFAAALISFGISPGDKVAVWGPNQPEWLVMKWACAKAGVAMVNINPLYTARELKYALEKVDAKLLICPKVIGPLKYHETITQMIPDLSTRDKHDLKVSSLPTLKKIVYYSTTESTDGAFTFDEFGDSADRSHHNILESITISAHEIANIQFTSGTTGMPKAAMLSHFNLTNNARSIILAGNQNSEYLNKDSVMLNVLPLYHIFSFVGGSTVGAILGIPNIYPAPGFNSNLSIKAIETRKATHLIGTPTMFTDMVNNKLRLEHDISSLSYAIVGGAPVTPALVKQAEIELDLMMAVGYGMTENSCATFLTPFGATEDITCNTVGYPIPGVEAKVIDDNENAVESGEVGELCTKGFVIFQGYVGDPEKTKESFTKDGYFKTGDLATVRPDGTMKLVGRSKDMIIRGGENIQPTEIENFICTHPKIQDCYVIGVPSLRLGEAVAAYAKLKENETMEISELTDYCKTGLARYKIPKYMKFVTEYPQTVTGKIKKFELRKTCVDDFPELAAEI